MSAKNMIETLEGRRLFSGGISTLGSVVLITGDSSPDTAKVTTDGPHLFVSLQHGQHTHAKTYFTSKVSAILFAGGDGNDKFTNDTGIGSLATGGNGNDLLIGGSGGDVLFGGNGNDSLNGRGGQDKLLGQGGADFLAGGTGNDYLDGGDDNLLDFVFGQAGTDTFKERPFDQWDRQFGEPIV
jgi:Ca2+-binding RTX toxin-like protein